ncbi:MAG: hypothetical protein JNN02_00600 [Tabrizicola sp.]|nr:hypothetical protein [Tabrizicola sp.]
MTGAGYDLPSLMIAAAENALQKVGQVLPVPLSDACRVPTWNAVPAEGVEHQVIRSVIREERKLDLT